MIDSTSAAIMTFLLISMMAAPAQADIKCILDTDCPSFGTALATCSLNSCLSWEIDHSCPAPPYLTLKDWYAVKSRGECHPSVTQESWLWTHCPNNYIAVEGETCPKK